MAETTQTIVAGLAAAFPHAKIDAATVRVYVKALADIPADELERAALAHIIDGRFFPSVRELRRTVAEAQAGLPSPDDAWRQANLWAEQAVREGRTIRCPNQECYGGVVRGGEPVRLDRAALDGIKNQAIRAALERMVEQAAEPTGLCPTCGGDGEIPNPRRAELEANRPHPAVMAALDHVGGPHGLLTADLPEVVRSQFLKAYDRIRDGAVRRISLEAAGLGELAGTTTPELPR